ncbi:uncharacterized protein [Coffea arabica]|uniref:Uncharacterized protein n=1 Tax=Coffea arabica TaxID=13443 RepID=A0A6P6UE34_COFAR|nr:uncharacterized protein LOC113709805 [Coffea arabica]
MRNMIFHFAIKESTEFFSFPQSVNRSALWALSPFLCNVSFNLFFILQPALFFSSLPLPRTLDLSIKSPLLQLLRLPTRLNRCKPAASTKEARTNKLLLQASSSSTRWPLLQGIKPRNPLLQPDFGHLKLQSFKIQHPFSSSFRAATTLKLRTSTSIKVTYDHQDRETHVRRRQVNKMKEIHVIDEDDGPSTEFDRQDDDYLDMVLENDVQMGTNDLDDTNLDGDEDNAEDEFQENWHGEDDWENNDFDNVDYGNNEFDSNDENDWL